MTSWTIGFPTKVALTGLWVAMLASSITSTLVVTSLMPGLRMKKSITRCSPFSGTHVSTMSSPGAMKPLMGSVAPDSAIISGV
eukprot:5912048-Heterocapsa_arctica.AAC.1